MDVIREWTKAGWRLRLHVRVGHGAWLTLHDERNPKRVQIVRTWEYPWDSVGRGIADAEMWAAVGGMTEDAKPQVHEDEQAETLAEVQ